MDVAKRTLKKPLLLEEFGKKLVASDDSVLFEQAIDRLRNPIFESTFQMVEAALQKSVPPYIPCSYPPCKQPITPKLFKLVLPVMTANMHNFCTSKGWKVKQDFKSFDVLVNLKTQNMLGRGL